MKVCPNCKKELEDYVLFCTKCGTKVESPVNEQNKVHNESLEDEHLKSQKALEDNKNSIESLFINPNEEKIAIIDDGYLSHYIYTGQAVKSVGLVTNKRFYFSGKAYYLDGGHLNKAEIEQSVDLQDITSSGFKHYKNIVACILSIIFLVLSVILLSISPAFSYGDEETCLICSAISGGIGIIALIVYLCSRKNLYQVFFSGGSIAMKTSPFNAGDLEKFDRSLRQAKDNLLDERNSDNNDLQ